MRIGVDFGYKYTGIALLDDENRVLECQVIEHRQLSGILTERRQRRSARRRNDSRRRRLRDFYALLKGMGLEPTNARPGEKMHNDERMHLGNRLYALAHYRGWDYADLSEFLVKYNQDGKPEKPEVIIAMDKILIKEYQAPQGKPIERKHKATICLKTPYLGRLYDLENAIYDHKTDKKTLSSTEEEKHHEERNKITSVIDEGDKDELEKWFKERLKAVFVGGNPPDTEKEIEIIDRTKVELGLEDNEKLFADGKVYRPNRNRHRDTMWGEMNDLLAVICGDDGGFDNTFTAHFDKTVKKTADKDKYRQQWRADMAKVKEKAAQCAQNRSEKEERAIGIQDIYDYWRHAAKKIINRQYRKKRFDNRKMGKCPAKTESGERCGKNLPRKAAPDLRKMQFEIEARRMNIVDGGGKRNMCGDEISTLMASLQIEKTPSREARENNKAVINAIKAPSGKDDTRGKKDVLRDLACGTQAGRTGFCRVHLRQRLELLQKKQVQWDDEGEQTKVYEDWLEKWERLHEDRILTLEDAPPSIRQKVEKVVGEVRRMLKKHKGDSADIKHIGLETARFDISALAQNEGKKLKKKKYQSTRRPADFDGLANAQGGLCFLCGNLLAAGGGNIDHLFPKRLGGGNVRLNKVATHAYCNIDKTKGRLNGGQVSQKALEILQEKDPDKAKYIRQRLSDGCRLPEDMLAAPQHTMFGAKVLLGALKDGLFRPSSQKRQKHKVLVGALKPTKAVFQRPRAGDIAYLRKQWFPLMNRQKAALRAKDKEWIDIEAIAETETKQKIAKIKLDGYLFDRDKLKFENLPEWLSVSDDTMIGTPLAGAEGIRKITVSCDNERVLLCPYVDDDDYESPTPKKTEIGKEVELKINDIRPKGWKTATVEMADKCWMKIKDETLLCGTPVWTEGGNGKKYVVWPRVRFTDDNGNILEVIIKVKTARRQLRLLVLPPDDAAIRTFHHALDATVMAADVNWKAILRMHKEQDERTEKERIDIHKQARKGRPDFSGWRPEMKGDDIETPAKAHFYIKDIAHKRTGQQKYKTEPYKIRDTTAYQRVPLAAIARKDIPTIQSDKIQATMKEAWQKVDNASDDDKKAWTQKAGKKTYLTQDYFRQLAENHILHPQNTRAVLCDRTGGIGGENSFEPLADKHWGRHDKRKNTTHYFPREENWSEAIVYQDAKGKLKSVRIKDKFYWRDKKQITPKTDTDSGEYPPEENIVHRFKRRDLVRKQDTDGIWQIKKLGNSAALEPYDEEAGVKEKSSVYNKLKPLKKRKTVPKNRKPPVISQN